jgi:hypothetical protein
VDPKRLPPPPTTPRWITLKTAGYFFGVWLTFGIGIGLILGGIGVDPDEMSGLYRAAGIVGLVIAFFVARRYWRSVNPQPRDTRSWHT